jgi:hypothetical protein
LAAQTLCCRVSTAVAVVRSLMVSLFALFPVAPVARLTGSSSCFAAQVGRPAPPAP